MARDWKRIVTRLLKHRWVEDERSRTIPPDMLERLTRRVATSEARHSGEIRVCVEAGLPVSYILRHATPRERAVAMFGKLRVWDTEHNNGVLIYLLLAEHAIEIVADRGVMSRTEPSEWQGIVEHMRGAFQGTRFEEGLNLALDEVTSLLVRHFPLAPGEVKVNELPDEPAVG